MDLTEIMSELPFVDHMGIEITEAADGHAEGRLAFQDFHSSQPGRQLAHGGVTFALADTVGGAAVVSETYGPSPTVDMRIDYLAPATTDLTATGDVIRHGTSTAVADVTVTDADDEAIAEVRGVYKAGDVPEGSAHEWGGDETQSV